MHLLSAAITGESECKLGVNQMKVKLKVSDKDKYYKSWEIP